MNYMLIPIIYHLKLMFFWHKAGTQFLVIIFLFYYPLF